MGCKVKEKDIQVVFARVNTLHGVFELKICKADKSGKLPPLPFSAVRDNQKEALAAIVKDGWYFKIPDSPVSWQNNGGGDKPMRFTLAKPFDCFYLKETPAYVVICYYIPRKLKEFVYIPIERFIEEERIATRKSLTRERAHDIAVGIQHG